MAHHRIFEQKSLLYKFSQDTSLHGFKRLWVGNVWRWPCWTLIILVGIVMSIYHIVDKVGVLIANPLNVNINLVYMDELEFPSITICNKLKVRASFVVNNTEFLDLIHYIYPTGSELNVTKKDLLAFKRVDQIWNAKEFFAQAGIPKEQTILWCRLPNGEDCSSEDFETIITDEGYCFKFKEKFKIKNTGRGNALRLMLNLAQYERLPGTDGATGLRLVIHEHNEVPMPGNGYDLMPGYQVAMHTQLGNCESSNPLKYYKRYTYPACRIERTLTDAALGCGCKPYTLPTLVKENYKNSRLERLQNCSILKHFLCMEQSIQDLTVLNITSGDLEHETHRAFCTGECERREFEQELYYNTYRENYAYRKMLGNKEVLIQESYQLGQDAGAFLNFYYNKDNDYMNVFKASSGYKEFIMNRKLVPPFGTVFEILKQQLPCMAGLLETFGSNVSDIKSLFNSFNTTLTGAIIKTISELNSKMDSLEIEKIYNFSNSLKEIHLKKCSNAYQDICSLPALYDMLKIRAQLEEKNAQIESLQIQQFKNLSTLKEIFGRDDDDVLKAFKHIDEEDKKELKIYLDNYVKQTNTCLSQLNQIYMKILNTGQPSMKSESVYDSFLNNLKKAKTVLENTCKQIKSLNGTDSRQKMAEKIIQLITNSETSSMKSIRFSIALVELIEEIKEKFETNGYDQRLLNQSLFDIENMDGLLNKYLNQTTQDVFTKSAFYNQLYMSNPQFQQGVNRYKTIIANHMMMLDLFFQNYVDKLITLYPGLSTDLIYLQSVVNLEDLISNSTNTTYETVEHIMCVKKAKFLVRHVESTLVGETDLESYKQYVNNLVYSLKLYIDDIRSLKGFYQENIGIVKIYYRDMGVKESTQERAYDFMSFLCDVGGIMGLWLGGSLISFFETFDILCIENIRHFFGCKSRHELEQNSLSKRSPTRDGSVTQYADQNQENGMQVSSNDGSAYNSCRESLSVNI